MKKPATFIGLFLVGAIVMFAFDNPFTLALGMLLQLAAVVLGIFVVAEPEFLEGDSGSAPPEPAKDA